MALTLSLTPGVSWAESDTEPTPTASVLKVDALETALTGDDTSEKGSGEVATSPSNTPESKPSASETQTADPEAGNPNDATLDAADTTKTPSSTGTTDAGQAGITPMIAGPDLFDTPYIYWEARSGTTTGALIGGASFTIEGPRSSFYNWSNSAVVEDNTGQAGYVGLDLDPDPGEFLVQNVGTHRINGTGRYRIQRLSAPLGYALGSTGWVEQSGNNNNGTWMNDVWNPAAFTFLTMSRSHTINVNKGDLRTALDGGTNVNVSSTYTVGARFGLYQSLTSANPIATCEITAAEQPCSFTGVNTSGVLYVGELAPASGSLADQHYSAPIQTLTTGTTTNGFTNRPYRYATPSLSANNNQTVTVPSAPTTTNEWDQSSGRFANVVKNPKLNMTCEAGVKVALVMDLSGSVVPYRDQFRDAAKGFVEELYTEAGVNSVAMFSFGTASPKANTSNYPNPVAVDANGLTALNSQIDGYWTNTVLNQGTNWDAGMWQAGLGNQTHDYDIVFVLTDGNPTYSATAPNGSGSLTTFRELERAVFSANVIKNQGARVVTIGIGAGLSNHNLSAVSGPQGYQAGLSLNDVDYTTAGWEELAALLADFANGISCQAGVTVQKLAAEGTDTPTPAPGWTFRTTATEGTVSAPAEKQTSGNNGTASWDIQFTQVDQEVSVTITETPQAEWSLESLACTVNGASVDVTQNDTAATIANVGVGDKVECVFTNRKAPTCLSFFERVGWSGASDTLSAKLAQWKARFRWPRGVMSRTSCVLRTGRRRGQTGARFLMR